MDILLQGKTTSSPTQWKPAVPKKIIQRIEEIVPQCFPNGIGLNFIDEDYFRQEYSEKFSEDFPADLNFNQTLRSVGVVVNSKVFVVPQQNLDRIKESLDERIAEGVSIFYYEQTLLTEQRLFDELNIFSQDVLQYALKKCYPYYYFDENAFKTNAQSDVRTEINRILKDRDGAVFSIDELQKDLPFIPTYLIRDALRDDKRFVSLKRDGDYIVAEKLVFSDEFIEQTLNEIRSTIEQQGYVSIKRLNFTDACGLNPDAPLFALQKVFTDRYLPVTFERNRNIISPLGKTVSSTDLFQKFCLAHEIFTLEELFEIEDEIYGNHISSQGLQKAVEVVVRVDETNFVQDDAVDFDVERIDDALALFMQDAESIPLKSIVSFTSFPGVYGFPWNLFLLESFCRRFSRRYCFNSAAANSKNAGAILISQRKNDDYSLLMARAVVAANVPTTPKEVGAFLTKTGYLANCNAKAVDAVVKNAITLTANARNPDKSRLYSL